MLNKKEILIKRFIGTDYESNSYIIYNNVTLKSIIIDPNDFNQISQFMKEKKLINEYIFLTHEHYDHVAALCSVKKHFGGSIISSEACNKGLRNVQNLLNRTYRLHMNFVGSEKSEIPQFEECEADISFHSSYEISWENFQIVLQETIGHSQGSTSIYFLNEMIFSGDAFLYGKPVITKMLGGNKEDYIKSTLAYYESLPKCVKVYPGHGEMFLLEEKLMTNKN